MLHLKHPQTQAITYIYPHPLGQHCILEIDLGWQQISFLCPIVYQEVEVSVFSKWTGLTIVRLDVAKWKHNSMYFVVYMYVLPLWLFKRNWCVVSYNWWWFPVTVIKYFVFNYQSCVYAGRKRVMAEPSGVFRLSAGSSLMIVLYIYCPLDIVIFMRGGLGLFILAVWRTRPASPRLPAPTPTAPRWPPPPPSPRPPAPTPTAPADLLHRAQRSPQHPPPWRPVPPHQTPPPRPPAPPPGVPPPPHQSPPPRLPAPTPTAPHWLPPSTPSTAPRENILKMKRINAPSSTRSTDAGSML